jgi:hypothetical protein
MDHVKEQHKEKASCCTESKKEKVPCCTEPHKEKVQSTEPHKK